MPSLSSNVGKVGVAAGTPHVGSDSFEMAGAKSAPKVFNENLGKVKDYGKASIGADSFEIKGAMSAPAAGHASHNDIVRQAKP